MARFIHCGDVHLGNWQYKNEERYLDFAKAFEVVCKYAVEHEVDFVLVTGDLFEKKTIDAGTLIQAQDILEPLKSSKLPVIVIEGNHDRRISSGESFSWLQFLNYAGYITLLTHQEDAEGRVILKEWKREGAPREGPSGNYIILEDTIIFGIGYSGSSTSQLLTNYAEAFKNNQHLFKNRKSILMVHAGLEGYLDKLGGAVDYNAFLPLKEYINYVALGHIHQTYIRENWIFNPGSLETWNISEVGRKRGFFDVVLKDDGVREFNFVEGEKWRRPFYTPEISLHGINSYPEALKHIEKELRKKISDSKKRGEISFAPRLKNGTIPLDAFSHENKKNTLQEDSRRAVVHITLKGMIGFNPFDFQKSDIEKIVRRLTDPLLVRVKNETYTPTVAPTLSLAKGRDEMEREVIKSLLEETREYKPVAEELASFIIELKTDLLHGADTEYLVNKLAKKEKEIKKNS
ncbi:MAG TPA: exonuclease SbcCD subunit D [Thermoplasmata archaeon]|nr:exonuclease SbcCD subunit D [Thermoplasmata archaeon]